MDYYFHHSCIIDDGVEIGNGTKIWHFCHISSGVVIGKNVSIGQNCFVDKNIKIGDGCKIQNNVSIYRGVECGKNVFIGPSVVFTNDFYPNAFKKEWEVGKTVLKDNCSIGANSTILSDITIEEFSLIGAGSVLTKSTERNSLYYGNPAKFISLLPKQGQNNP